VFAELDLDGRQLRRLAGDARLDGVRADLRNQLGRAATFLERRLAENHGAHAQAGAERFFQHAHALDRAVAVGSQFGVGEGGAQLLDQRVLAAADVPQPVLGIHRVP